MTGEDLCYRDPSGFWVVHNWMSTNGGPCVCMRCGKSKPATACLVVPSTEVDLHRAEVERLRAALASSEAAREKAEREMRGAREIAAEHVAGESKERRRAEAAEADAARWEQGVRDANRIAQEHAARADRAEAALEEYRMRLAGALTTVEGNALDLQDKPDTLPYLRTCPTIRACVDVRRRMEAAFARAESSAREVDRLREELAETASALRLSQEAVEAAVRGENEARSALQTARRERDSAHACIAWCRKWAKAWKLSAKRHGWSSTRADGTPRAGLFAGRPGRPGRLATPDPAPAPSPTNDSGRDPDEPKETP